MTNEEIEKKLSIEEYWNKQVKILEGKTIKKAEYMSKERMEKWDWYNQALEITFTDGTSMLLSSDDEGNGPGSAFTNIDGLETIPRI
jgi:hypothetical protein